MLVTISGDIVTSNAHGANDGITWQLHYGTGTAPSNGAGSTGSTLGSFQTYTLASAATAAGDVNAPFSKTFAVKGLTVGTTYWFDLSAAYVTAANFAFSNLDVVLEEQ